MQLAFIIQISLMLWQKSTIKSKYEKNAERVRGSALDSKKPIEILSSDEQMPDQNIQKRRYQSTPPTSQPIHYNKFDLKRMKKVEYNPTPVSKDDELCIIQSQGPLDERQRNEKSLISYKVEGNFNITYVSQLFLTTRVNKIKQNILKQKLQIKETTLDHSEKEEKEGQSTQKTELKRHFRYFDKQADLNQQQRVVKCFRCSKRGHIAKNCIEQQQRIKCTYCLGDHHHHDCGARTCFRCNQIGHVSQQCKSIGTVCHRCNKRGHLAANCGVVLFLDYHKQRSDKQLKQKYDYNDLKRLKCMNDCRENGHFNCYEYNQKRKRPYQDNMRKINYY